MSDMDYILDENDNPIREPDLKKWAAWRQKNKRHVAEDWLPGDVHVSTVFLGLDHNFLGDGPPVLWETMIFGGEHDQYQDRYSTKEDAIVGHRRAVRLASSSLLIDPSLESDNKVTRKFRKMDE
jgi:hypothetical protein